MIRSLLLLSLAVAFAGCSKQAAEPPKQTYVEALSLYNAEAAALDTMEKKVSMEKSRIDQDEATWNRLMETRDHLFYKSEHSADELDAYTRKSAGDNEHASKQRKYNDARMRPLYVELESQQGKVAAAKKVRDDAYAREHTK